MKLLSIFVLAGSLSAQLVPPSVVGPVQFPELLKPSPSVTAYVTPQGSDVIARATGVTPHLATLANVNVCNETDQEVVVSISRIYRQIQLEGRAHPLLMSSEIVDEYLSLFQQNSIYTRLFKGAVAATSITTILETAFRGLISPILATSLQLAPQLYSAILPVVHDPRDLRDLSKHILQENTPMQLGKRECKVGLVVVRGVTIAPEQVTIQ